MPRNSPIFDLRRPLADHDGFSQEGLAATTSPIARIRREHFIKGKTIKEIARDLNGTRCGRC
jgi:gamma-glutamyltranspeptidase